MWRTEGPVAWIPGGQTYIRRTERVPFTTPVGISAAEAEKSKEGPCEASQGGVFLNSAGAMRNAETHDIPRP